MRAFFIRILQVVWIISILTVAVNVFDATSSPHTPESELIGLLLIWFALLIVVQYLAFASFNPSWAFGENKGRYLSIFMIASIFIAAIGGIGLKIYNTNEYNKKLEAGTDIVFFEGVLRDTMISYGLSECRDTKHLPNPSKDDLRAAISKVESRNIKGLNILATIANQNDAVGRGVRCLFDKTHDIQQVADIIDTINKKPAI